MLGKESNRGVTKKYVVYVVNVAFLEIKRNGHLPLWMNSLYKHKIFK